MKDLDFDELDRAVSSLMKDTPATDPEPKLADEQTVTINPTIKDGDKPSLANLSQAVSNLNGSATTPGIESTDSALKTESLPKPDPVPAAEPKQTVSVASRRGRFMDVVRPGTTKPEAPVRRQSREGIAIDPTRPIVNDVSRPSPNPPAQKEATTVAEASPIPDSKTESTTTAPSAAMVEPKTDEEPVKEDWPDPIAMAGYEESELPAKSTEVDKKPDADTPLVSPFLADAKVEKRPLGGQPTPILPVEEPEPETPGAEDAAPNDDDSAQLTPTPAAEKPLPEELSGDLIALESDANTAAAQPVNEESVTPVQKQEPALEAPMVAPAPTPVTSPTPTGAISIPQQYKEEPSSGDKSTGSIYDTDTYHQPLAHPGKKKSGWMWVIWIILILILGAGAGAALYYFKVF